MQGKLKIWLRDGVVFLAIIALAIWLGAQLPRWYSMVKGPFKSGDYSQHVKSQTYALTLYGTSTCPHCDTARRFLNEAGIPFNDLVVDKSKVAEVAYKTLGEKAVPVFVSADKLIVGFDKEAYLKLIASVKSK
jgi:glutaredoxin 3